MQYAIYSQCDLTNIQLFTKIINITFFNPTRLQIFFIHYIVSIQTNMLTNELKYVVHLSIALKCV